LNAFNYAGDQDMTLTEDALIVKGISGGAAYFPAGKGHIPFTGEERELSVSFWRKWDGEQEPHHRVLCACNTFALYFDGEKDGLTILLRDKHYNILSEKDSKTFVHWCILFARKDHFIVYKNGKEFFKTEVANYPIDLAAGFDIGGGRTHATFDEVRFYRGLLTEDEIQGLYRLKTTGTELSQVEKVAASAAKVAAESAAETLTALHTPHYLGTVKVAPKGAKVNIHIGRKNGLNHASIGDWILIIDSIPGYKKGWCYRWDGNTWQMLDPPDCYSSEYTSCLRDLLELKEMFKDTKFFGSVFCQVLGANEVIGQNFVAKRLRVDSDPDRNTDYEVDINEDVGIRVKNYGDVIFSVGTDGRVFLNGSSFRAGPFFAARGVSSASTVSFAGRLISDIFKALARISGTVVFVACQGTVNGRAISFFKAYKDDKTKAVDIETDAARSQVSGNRVDNITWRCIREEWGENAIEFYDCDKNLLTAVRYSAYHTRTWLATIASTEYQYDFDPYNETATDWEGRPLDYYIFKPTYVTEQLSNDNPDRYFPYEGSIVLKQGGSIIQFDDIPASPEGLATGQVWAAGDGTLKIVR